jgi:hypothetical protein
VEKKPPAVHSGKMTHYIPENNVYTYFRYNDDNTVMIVLNNSKESTKLSTKRFAENIQKHISKKTF